MSKTFFLFYSNEINLFRARGVYYVTTGPKPPYAKGFPGKELKRFRRDNFGTRDNLQI